MSSNHPSDQPQGVVAEWLSRMTRNHIPSGASVRIWPTSSFFPVFVLLAFAYHRAIRDKEGSLRAHFFIPLRDRKTST
jgi:hypothetical protein